VLSDVEGFPHFGGGLMTGFEFWWKCGRARNLRMKETGRESEFISEVRSETFRVRSEQF
jgi:hypothetical protein